MKKIKLYNRDGADLWLERTDGKVDDNIFGWTQNMIMFLNI